MLVALWPGAKMNGPIRGFCPRKGGKDAPKVPGGYVMSWSRPSLSQPMLGSAVLPSGHLPVPYGPGLGKGPGRGHLESGLLQTWIPKQQRQKPGCQRSQPPHQGGVVCAGRNLNVFLN